MGRDEGVVSRASLRHRIACRIGGGGGQFVAGRKNPRHEEKVPRLMAEHSKYERRIDSFRISKTLRKCALPSYICFLNARY